jgi:hypothetical protein
MKVSKQQKILGGLMLAGAVLIGADQLGMLPGSTAEATEATSEYAMAPAAAPSTVAPAAAVTAPAIPSSQPSVAERLRQVAHNVPQETMRDVFALGPGWQSQVPHDPTVDPAARAVEKFKQSHKLTGVLTGRGEHAVVDNRIVTVGQVVDGFTLVAVSHRMATFESGGSRVVLNMGSASSSVAGAQ